MEQREFEAALMQFIVDELPTISDRLRERAARRHAPSRPLTADTNLFESGFVDSLGLIYLIATLEDLLSVEVTEEQIVMRNFRSITAIWRAFAAPDARPGGLVAD